MATENQKVALITGITGQDGSYLAELLLSKGYQVNGLMRRSSSFNTERIDHIYQDPHETDYKFKLWYGDLADPSALLKLLAKIKPDEVYNLGAQSVAEQCLCPILSAQNLEYRTLGDLWNEQVKKKKQISREKVGSVEVEVINLGKNTQLKALGMWNGMGTWFHIKQISRHWWKGKIVKLSQKFGSVMVTPNHSILDVNGKICTPKENPWLLSVRKLNYKPNKYRHNIRLKLDGVYKTDKTHFWLDEKGVQGKVLKVVAKDKLMAFCRFIGAFISEGHTTFNKANGNWYVGISSGNKQWLKELEIDLKVFYKGKCWYIRHKKGNLKDVWELQIKSKTLYRLFRKLLGENSRTKQLPHWFSQIKKEYLLEIWKKMLEGDGCIDSKRGFRYTTISYKLACQLSWLLTTAGYDYTVHEETNNGLNNVWHFRECTSYQPNQGSNERKIEWMDYDGWVYDITVDEVHNFSVGVGNIVVHNSHVRVSFDIPEYTADIDAIGTLRLLEAIRSLDLKCRFYQASSSEMFGSSPPPQNEKTSFHPRSPYAVSKVFSHNIVVNYREAYGMFACSGILFNHECVTGQTPIFIKKNGIIDIVAIEEIVPHRENPRHGTKYTTFGTGDMDVWDGVQWSRITTMTATWNKVDSPQDKKVKQVVCRGGYYEATQDHISFLKGGKKIKTGVLKPKDHLELKTFPPNTSEIIVTVEEAEFLGMMVADGHISENGKARLINNDVSLRQKGADLWKRIRGGYSQESIHPSGFRKNIMIGAVNFFGDRDYCRLLRKEIYNEQSFKKVPKRIINSNKEIMIAFLRGYNACDGLKGGRQKTEFKSFTTNSTVLAQGLWYMVSSVLGLHVTIHPEFRQDKIYFHLNINTKEDSMKGKHLQRDITEVKAVRNCNYKGWLFDLETQSGTFSAGIGLTWIHNSPRRGETFVTRKITRGLAKILSGKEKKIYLGNLEAKRDWGYAPEYCEAMWIMLQQDKPDDYVIATGESHSVKEFVEEVFKLVGLDWKKYVEKDARYFRPSEVDNLCGDSSKAKEHLGWQPRVAFKDLAKMMLIEDLKKEGIELEEYGLPSRHPLTAPFLSLQA